MLVTSNFSFSDSVFKGLEDQTRKNQALFEKGKIHGEKIWDHTCIILFYSQLYNVVMVKVRKKREFFEKKGGLCAVKYFEYFFF